MRRSIVPTLAALAVTAGLTGGCNRYEMFRLAGFAQEDFSNDAEILFVIDNSSSMLEESAALGVNFDLFIDNLVDPTGEGGGLDGLPDAVDDYILSVSDRGRVVDFQIGITTTDIAADYGALYDFSGEAVLQRTTPNVADRFRENLLCEATCFQGANGGLDSKNDVGRESYTCGDPLESDVLFFEYMDCICGEDVWMDNCGSGQEEGLEATLLAMCRGLDPADESQSTQILLEECADATPFDPAVHGNTNAALFRAEGREDSIIIPIVVTDEGDGSRRLSTGESATDAYDELFGYFGRRMAWGIIGPTTEGCRTGGNSPPSWSIERYESMVEQTDGLYVDITQRVGDDCEPADFAAALEDLSRLLNSLLDKFPLQAIPEIDTIRVEVDGKQVDPAPESFDEDGNVTYGDGWTYLAAENAVEFHGEAIPDYSARVRITYRPLDGKPRDLPF